MLPPGGHLAQEVSRALGGGSGERAGEKELGSDLSGRGVGAVALHEPRVPAGSALVPGSVENEKRPRGRVGEDASGRSLPPSPLPSSRPGPSQEEPASEGGETENKVTADVRDVRTGGEHGLTCISPSSSPSPYSCRALFWMAPSAHTQAGLPPPQRRQPLGRYYVGRLVPKCHSGSWLCLWPPPRVAQGQKGQARERTPEGSVRYSLNFFTLKAQKWHLSSRRMWVGAERRTVGWGEP